MPTSVSNAIRLQSRNESFPQLRTWRDRQKADITCLPALAIAMKLMGLWSQQDVRIMTPNELGNLELWVSPKQEICKNGNRIADFSNQLLASCYMEGTLVSLMVPRWKTRTESRVEGGRFRLKIRKQCDKMCCFSRSRDPSRKQTKSNHNKY